MTENIRLKWALFYLEKMNFSVIPIRPGDKRPLIPWQKYQAERASPDLVRGWFNDEPNANIGIVTGAISNLNVIDVDSDAGRENINPYLPDSFLAPTVHTPRGGLHFYCRHHEGMTNKAGLIPETDFRGEGGYVVAPPSANGNGKQYRWDSSLRIGDTGIPALPSSYINKIISTFKRGECKEAENPDLTNLTNLTFLTKGTRDNDIFHVMNCLAKGGYEKELAYKVAEIIAKSCSPKFSAEEAALKVESAYGRTEKREISVAQSIREFVTLHGPYIYLTEALQTLQILHDKEKTAAYVAFNRLCKDGTLERISHGCFKKLEKDCEDIDIFSDDGAALNIKYPLGLHELIITHPKNIIIVAGAPDAGKTAYLLNFAQMNSGGDHEVVYFSSEMGKIEIRERLKKFKLPMSEWKKIKWKERAADFASVVRPNAINIIDFLEVHDEFYKVGLFIKQIHDKLENGIAIIALQKNKGRDEGLGGMRSLEKARLYLAMESGRIKIVKAKNWRNDEINPNNLVRTWKLGGGCNFRPEGEWYKEEPVSGRVQYK